MKIAPFTATLLVAAALTAAANADPTYSVVAAIRVSDSRTTALATNDLGLVAGLRAYTGTTTVGTRTQKYEGYNAFLTAADGADAVNVLPLPGYGIVAKGKCRGLVFSSALTAVNASGVAVGESTVAVGSGSTLTYVTHAALYSATTLTDLGTLGDATGTSTATGINASGLIVGTSIVTNRTIHAFSYDGTAIKDLGTLGGKTSYAAAVNDAGTIVGSSTLLKGALHPFSYSGTTMTDLGLPDGYSAAAATGISSDGTIVGWGATGRTTGSFYYSAGAYTKLGSLYTIRGKATPMQANGINASLTIVGATLNASGKPRAFIYQGGTLYDLNTSLPTDYAGWTIVSATSITDSGYISTLALDSTGKQYGLLLKLS